MADGQKAANSPASPTDMAGFGNVCSLHMTMALDTLAICNFWRVQARTASMTMGWMVGNEMWRVVMFKLAEQLAQGRIKLWVCQDCEIQVGVAGLG